MINLNQCEFHEYDREMDMHICNCVTLCSDLIDKRVRNVTSRFCLENKNCYFRQMHRKQPFDIYQAKAMRDLIKANYKLIEEMDNNPIDIEAVNEFVEEVAEFYRNEEK